VKTLEDMKTQLDRIEESQQNLWQSWGAALLFYFCIWRSLQ
jgi:hypothetical protein